MAFDFTEGRGTLVGDDFSGYKACFELGVTKCGCLAHARRKFHELWINQGSPVGERALKFFQERYDIEREVRDLQSDERRRMRKARSEDVANALQQWLQQQRQLVPGASPRAGQHAAAVMSLLHSAKLNGHDPYSRLEELLPHRWQPHTVA